MSDPHESSTFKAAAVVERSGSPAVMYGMNATFPCDFNFVKVCEMPMVGEVCEMPMVGKGCEMPTVGILVGARVMVRAANGFGPSIFLVEKVNVVWDVEGR